MKKLIKRILNAMIRSVSDCAECNYTDVCKDADYYHEVFKPLTQRGEIPVCFECNHSLWNIGNVDKRVNKCCTCPLEWKAGEVIIKHQRG